MTDMLLFGTLTTMHNQLLMKQGLLSGYCFISVSGHAMLSPTFRPMTSFPSRRLPVIGPVLSNSFVAPLVDRIAGKAKLPV